METVIDLRVLDDVFQGSGIYHPQKTEGGTGTGQAGPHLSRTRIHLILLNWELLPGGYLLKLLRAAASITCADGGANRLLDRLWQYDLPTIADVFYIQGTEIRKPLFIIGDLDSYSPIIDRTTGKEKPPSRSLEKFGFEVIQIKNDYNTDFDKVRLTLETRGVIQDGDTLVVDGAFGGRFDQTTSTLSALYKSVLPDPTIPKEYHVECSRVRYQMLLIGDETLCTLLPPGESIVKPPKAVCTQVCGLLPFIRVESVTTKGLKWDVENVTMAMNALVSSSNEVADGVDDVRVSCTEPIVWYSQLKSLPS